MASLAEIRGSIASRITNPLVGALSKSGLTPNALTFIGLAINIGAAYLVATNHFLWGGILILLSGLFDLLDGALARFSNQATRFGAILDSTVDRISEAAIFCALLICYVPKGATVEVWLIFAALIGSFLVSYIKARGEGLGLECRIGLFTRAERVIVLAIGLLVNQVLIALWILVPLVYITVIQRLLYLRKQGKTVR
jgi:CDP-diacylglycerol--glycerol-3-phosphate 3-phosphatidyltransferase